MSELLREPKPKSTTASGGATAGLSPVDAVRVVINTAVSMSATEQAISVRSVLESSRGAGLLIWIPGYIWNGDTVIAADPAADPTID